MKNEISIKIMLNRKLEFGDHIIFQNSYMPNNEITLNDVLTKSLSKVFPKLKSTEDKIKELINIFNESEIKELLILDLNKKPTIRKLIECIDNKTINSKDVEKLKYKNTALISKTTKQKHKDNLLKNNALVFFGELIFKLNDNGKDMKVYFDLSRLELLKTSHMNREESIDISEFKIVNIKDESEILLMHKGDKLIAHLSKNHNSHIIDFYNNNSRIELNKYDIFMKNLKFFMKENERDSVDVVTMEEKIFKSSEEVSFIIKADKKGSAMISEGKKVFLLNVNFRENYECTIRKKEPFDYSQFILNKMNKSELEREKVFNNSKNLEKIILINKNEHDKKAIKNQPLRIRYSEKLKSLNGDKVRLNNCESDLKNELEYFNTSLKKIIQDTKGVKKQLNILVNKTRKKTKKQETNEFKSIEIELKNKIINFKKDQEIIKLKKIKIEKELKNNSSLEKIVDDKIEANNQKIISIDQLETSYKKTKISNEKKLKELNRNLSLIVEHIDKCSHEISLFEKSELIFFRLKVKIKQDSAQNKKDIIFNKINLEFIFISEEKPSWTLSSFDKGFFMNIKRYSNTLQNAKEGFYKNPYLISALNKPSVVEIKNIDNINNKLNLNPLQEIAVKKALMTDDIAYIQGPPGTGKTQTISAIASTIVKDGDKVLISSYLHAAINNFFERLSKNEEDNPNIFLLRYIYKKTNEDYDFSEEEMYSSFLGRIDKFVNKDKKMGQINKLVQIVSNFSGFGDSNKYDHPSELLMNFLISKYKNNSPQSNSENIFLNIARKSFSKLIEPEEFEFDIKHYYSKAQRKDNQTIIWSDIVNEVYKVYPKIKIEQIISKEKLLNFLKEEIKCKSSSFNDAYNLFSKWEKNNSIGEEDFKKAVLKNKLINVIGITTTAGKNFSFLNKKMKLFIEYPIDYVIIDEVSKSTTPEIISCALLAKKVILAGDYRQLPPSLSNMSTEFIEQFFKSKYGELFKIKYPTLNDKEPKQLEQFLKTMYSNSLFKNQINEIKKGNYENKAYQFLKTQYRFTKNIMDVVNISYDNDEQLEFPKDFPQSWSTFNISFYGQILNGSFNVIDTSLLNDEFIKEINANAIDKKIFKNLKQGDSSFDQNKSIFNKRIFSARINEYNSFIIGRLVKKIIETKKVKNENIGIICMTKTQKEVIKSMLKQKEVCGIKVDTVDNFQGSEKDIIIFDAVAAKDKLTNEGVLKELKSRNVDFYERTERLNVAISRAKSKIFIVGAFKNFLSKEVISTMEIDGEEVAKKFMKIIEDAASKQGGYICTSK